MANLTGSKLGKYEIVERLAQGGMAEVYKAFQPGVERLVVIKVLHDHLAESADFRTRFQREARAIGSLQHPHIVRIIDSDAENERYYMVMDYVEGGSLAEYIKERQRLPVEEALHIGGQVANALAYAHTCGIIHRDIKPSNILFVDDTQHRVVLADFGLARLCEEGAAHLTMTGAMVGTPTYMSPEAVRGEVCDGRADIFSLGVVLYELVTGKTPYVANTPYSMMMKMTNEPLPSPRTLNPALPLPVEELLLKALAKSPEERFSSADELAQAIGAVQARLFGEQVSPRQPAAVAKQQGRSKPPPVPIARWLPLALAVGGVMLVTLLTTQILMHF